MLLPVLDEAVDLTPQIRSRPDTGRGSFINRREGGRLRLDVAPVGNCKTAGVRILPSALEL